MAKSLEMVEKQTHEVLYPAPKAILQGQQATRRSRIGYQQMEPKLLRAYQFLSLLNRLLLTQSQPTKLWGVVRRNRPRSY
ncbi:hypothetical protein C7B64_08015 [Merismopedia glauca CCAP 1448/3]|uniref:Uncharacterized protein n=2 Tax=Merismopedia TaxID=53402 RepID=A0A2T1C5G3_9CYAN|nr:hypothetical protein C7B64_08015 [Merismopedia glauca CCAP 1448/3]